MRALLLLFPLLALFGCSNPPYRGSDVLGADEFVMDSYKIREGKFSVLQMSGKDLGSLAPQHLEEYHDVIQEGDILQIAIYHPTRTDISEAVQKIGAQIGYRVTNGKVVLPDLEAIEVAGLTLEAAREKIQKKYQDQIRDIEVFLAYRDRIQRKVELAGLVQVPNIPVDGRMRLFETLSIAKVPPQANFFKSYMVRDNLLMPVDFYKLMKEGDMSQNIVMRGGDKIYIADASAASLMVLGEVGKERVVDLPNGFMTLRQAIAEAGGIPYTGDKGYIQVIRGNILQPKIYTLNWRHVIHLPSDSMLLIPGDIVYVAATPLTEWNRFVSQILPTLIGFDLVTKGIKTVGVNVQ